VRARTPELGTASQKLRKLNTEPIRNFRLLSRSNALLRICYELIANYAEFADMKSFAQAKVRASPSRIVELLYFGRRERAVVETNINGQQRTDTAETWRLFRKYYAPPGSQRVGSKVSRP